jgi:hypothetical protein
MKMDMEKLQYPIGQLEIPVDITNEMIHTAIMDIGLLPERIDAAISNVNQTTLEKTYREGGWNLRQVIHHIADSHMNALIRFKLALTESTPVIKPYREDLWALLPDYSLAITSSLSFIHGVHMHWKTLMESLSDEQWNKDFYHPERGENITLKQNALLYQWHGNHHLAHIKIITES